MKGDNVSRRHFLGAAGLGACALMPAVASAHGGKRRVICPPRPCPPPSPLPCPPPPSKECPHVCARPNIATLSEAQLQSLKNGVAAMRARAASDPTSWRFQANIHGTVDAVTSPLWNQCEHGTIQFFTWHRGYLYYFERILRAAAGDPTLCLPYWDWSTSPSLPAAFMDSSAGNPLYEPSRFINDGSAIPAGIVVTDTNNALAETDFYPFPGFSARLEGSPHGAVHGQVGGIMGAVSTAANDPIFWLHHCNIDRLWDRWLNQGGGRINPSDAAFLDQEYSYADMDGSTVTVKVRDILSSAKLCYHYDDTPNPPLASVMATIVPMATQQATPPVEVASSAAGQAVAAEARRPLGLDTEAVSLRTTEGRAEALATGVRDAAPRGPNAARVFVVIRDVEFAEAPAFNYEVFLNLPADADAATEQKHRVGTVNFFGKGEGKGHAHAAPGPKRFTETLDATQTVARLRDSGTWNNENLRVTLRAVAPTPPQGAEAAARERLEASSKAANMSYASVALSVAR